MGPWHDHRPQVPVWAGGFWIKGCSFAAKSLADRNTSEGTWKDFRQALVYKARPRCDPGPEDYECWIKGEVVDFKDFWREPDMPVFTDGSALHGLHPGLEVASIGAFQFGRDGVTKYIKMRLPKEMRQLSGTAEFLAVEIAARHSREGERLHIVTDCLTVVQSWQSSVWRRDDYRNLAGGFWRLMGERAPHLVSKVRAHLGKRQARKVGLCEEWRRGNEVVDNIARGLVERAYE